MALGGLVALSYVGVLDRKGPGSLMHEVLLKAHVDQRWTHTCIHLVSSFQTILFLRAYGYVQDEPKGILPPEVVEASVDLFHLK